MVSFAQPQPSRQSGFAPRDGAPLYPSVADMFGGWVPALGATGKTLFDVTRKNNGTFLSAVRPVWGVDSIGQGGRTLLWDGDTVVSGISLGDIADFRFEVAKTWSCICSFSCLDLGTDDRAFIRKYGVTTERPMVWRADNSTPAPIQVFREDGEIVTSTFEIIINTWYTTCLTNDGTGASGGIVLRVYDERGLLLSEDSGTLTADSATLTAPLIIWGDDDDKDEFNGNVGPMYFYNRVLAGAEQDLIARDNLAPVRLAQPAVFLPTAAGPATLSVSGTITDTVDESDITAGGKQLILTLANETWVTAAGA